MRTLINALADTRPGSWDSVLLTGAGTGAQLPLLRRLQSRRLFLAEPQPDQRNLLVRAADQARGEQVLAFAITAGPESEVTLRLCANPAFTSLAAPGKLLEILPNLRMDGEVSVPAKALRNLVAECDLDPSLQNLLVVDAPGQLALLGDTEGLRAFTHIVVKAGSEPLYEGDPAGSEMEAALATAGFELAGVDPEAIYPFLVQSYSRNDARLELDRIAGRARQIEARFVAAVKAHEAELAKVLAAHDAALAEQARLRDAEKTDALSRLEAEKSEMLAKLAAGQEAHEAELRKLSEARDAEKADALSRLEIEKSKMLAALALENKSLEAKLAAETEAHEAELARLVEARDAALVEQAREWDAILAKKVGELDAELQAIRSQVAEGQARVGELQAQARELEREKAELLRELGLRTNERDDAARKSEEQRGQLEHLKQRLGHLDDQLCNARDATALAVRLQTLRENDLEEMRQRYQELHRAHQSQRALLAKLSRRLVAANEYFQQLAGSGMLSLEATVVAEPPVARKKPGRSRVPRKTGGK